MLSVGKELAAEIGEANILIVPTDVSKLDQVVALRDRVYEAWGEVRIASRPLSLFLLHQILLPIHVPHTAVPPPIPKIRSHSPFPTLICAHRDVGRRAHEQRWRW